MSGYQVDLNGPNEMDSQYWAYLSKQVIDTSVEFIRLLDKCKIKMGVKLVPLSLMRKMYKLQTTARYQRINHFIPVVLDHHIEEIIQCTFKKIGKPMPKISAKEILQQLVQHAKQRCRETILKKHKEKIHLEID